VEDTLNTQANTAKLTQIGLFDQYIVYIILFSY